MGYYPWQHCKLQEHCAFFTGVDRPCLDQSGTTSSPSAPPCHHQHWQKPILSIHSPTSQVGIIRVYAASVQGVPVDQFRWVRYFRTKRPQTRIGTFLCGKTFTVKAEFAMHIASFTPNSSSGFYFRQSVYKLQTLPLFHINVGVLQHFVRTVDCYVTDLVM